MPVASQPLDCSPKTRKAFPRRNATYKFREFKHHVFEIGNQATGFSRSKLAKPRHRVGGAATICAISSFEIRQPSGPCQAHSKATSMLPSSIARNVVSTVSSPLEWQKQLYKGIGGKGKQRSVLAAGRPRTGAARRLSKAGRFVKPDHMTALVIRIRAAEVVEGGANLDPDVRAGEELTHL